MLGNIKIVQYFDDSKHAKDSYKYAKEAVRILDATLGDNDQWDLTTQNYNNITFEDLYDNSIGYEGSIRKML